MATNRRSLKNTKPSKQSDKPRFASMAPPGGVGKRKRYSCGGKVKK
jgi:hypothetical protein